MFSQFDQRLAALEEQVSRLQEQNKTLEKENTELKAKSSHNTNKVPICIFHNTVLYINNYCTQADFFSKISSIWRISDIHKNNVKFRIDIESLCHLQNVHEFNITRNRNFNFENILFYNKGVFICSAPSFETSFKTVVGDGGPYPKSDGLRLSLAKNIFQELVKAFSDIKINLLLDGVDADLINLTFK
jgi:hypothetical protein